VELVRLCLLKSPFLLALLKLPPTKDRLVFALLHDRDMAFHAWAMTAPAMSIDDVLTAVRSPWQNAYAERLIGSIRRESLDHVIIGNARGLGRVLHTYVEYYLKVRTHLSLDKDAPISRPVASGADGDIVAIPHLGGLHHRYERRAA